jgi:integrase
MLLLTAVRTTELRLARWAEIDTKAKLWRVPATRMKAGVEHIVPLSPQVLNLLAELRAISGEGELLFPHLFDPEQPMSEGTIINNIRYGMGYAGRATGHGMRRTFSTWCNEQGFNPDAVERQLAHGERNAVRAAYNSAEYLPERRRMMAAWVDFLDESERGAKVVPIRGAK